MPTNRGPDEHPAQRHQLATVLAVGLVAYVLAKLIHEGVGHGLVCELTDGELRGFSSSWCDCDKQDVTTWGTRAIKAGGTLANLLFGGALLLWLRRRPPRAAALYYFVWLSAAVHLFMAGGYLMVDPLFRFGDWGQFLEGLTPPLLWRLGLVTVGLALSMGTFFLLRAPLEPLLGPPDGLRKRRARLLCWLPYLAIGGGVMTLAALLNSLGPKYAFTSALATLGGTYLLAWIPASVTRAPASRSTELTMPRSTGWLVAGGLSLAFLLLFLGPGISLR